MKKVIVFSGANIRQGGPLTILDQFVRFASAELTIRYKVYFIVHDRTRFEEGFPSIEFVEAPRSNWKFLKKIYLEYVYFKKLSKQLRPFIWFSLNDCSPSVSASVRCVYIHNATALYQPSFLDFVFPSRVLLQKVYYPLFIKYNLNRNNFVIVQQNSMKRYIRKCGYTKGKILINRPYFHFEDQNGHQHEPNSTFTFIYPTKPEVYKNLHTLISAVRLLKERKQRPPEFRVILTISGNENRYSRHIKHIAKDCHEVEFAGPQPHQELMRCLQKADCLIFPSKLETWGLPLTEASFFNLHIIAADLPYAKETLANYDSVCFFPPNSARELAAKMGDLLLQHRPNRSVVKTKLETVPDVSYSLGELFAQILPSD